MSKTQIGLVAMLAGLALGVASEALAQQIKLTTPLQQLSDKYYENFNVNWGFTPPPGKNGNVFFNMGAANSTPPPFGGYDPAADARFGFGIRTNAGNFNFGISAGQGNSRTNTVTAPSIVIPNGGTGYLFDGSSKPFVMGVVPVVGNNSFNLMPPMVPSGPSYASPLQERLSRLQQGEKLPGSKHQPSGGDSTDEAAGPSRAITASRGSAGVASTSTANHGDVSVKEIQSQQAAEDATRQQELAERLEKARAYEEAGKTGIARMYYQQAAARATGEQKKQLLEKIQTLSSSSK